MSAKENSRTVTPINPKRPPQGGKGGRDNQWKLSESYQSRGASAAILSFRDLPAVILLALLPKRAVPSRAQETCAVRRDQAGAHLIERDRVEPLRVFAI